MRPLVFHRLLAILLIGFFSFPALAQYPLDTSANQKIDEAINQHYLMMNLDKAENLLLGTVEACKEKCRPSTKAKAWMYVGIVRGSGKSDLEGAKQAFGMAKSFDPSVELDEALATPETKAAFAQSTAGASGSAATPTSTPTPPAEPAEPLPTAEDQVVPGDMVCTPNIREAQINMPIPISCTSAISPASAELKFKEPGGQQWKKIDMAKVGEEFRATVPCDLTTTPGELLFYVGAKDEAGEYVDQYGSRKEPGTIFLETTTTAPAPSYPGEAPVSSCQEKTDTPAEGASDCPPDFPGCASGEQKQCGDLDWGASCNNSAQCKCGLICEDGACANAPSCATDDDCDTGTCVDGACSVVSDGSSKIKGPFKRHWLNFDVGIGFAQIGGTDLCSTSRQNEYGSYCYFDADGAPAVIETADGRYDPVQNPAGGGNPDVGTGFALAQLRVRVGYDFAITDHLLVGARVGAAFLNTYPDFIPVHAEGRVSYSITSLSDDGFRALVFVNGGLGEMDAKAQVFLPDARRVNVFKVGGPVFAGGGASLGYALAPNMALSADVAAAVLIGTGQINFGLQPGLSFTYGL